MKRLIRILSLLSLLLMLGWGSLGWSQPGLAGAIDFQSGTVLLAATASSSTGGERLCADTGSKIDLNNANMVVFSDCPGFYPTLAQLIVANGPYDKVEDVLNIPGLKNRQKELLKANLDSFTVSESVVPPEMRMPPRPAIGKFPAMSQ